MAEAGKKSLRVSAIIAAIIAAVLYVVDAFCSHLPFFALVLFAVVVMYFLPATLYALRKDRRIAWLRAKKVGIFLLAAVSIVFTTGLQNRMAERRAVKLGEACLAYRAKYHRYPRDLQALVPEFISSVPVARYGVFEDDRFNYQSNEDNQEPILFYQEVPPFGWSYYYGKPVLGVKPRLSHLTALTTGA